MASYTVNTQQRENIIVKHNIIVRIGLIVYKTWITQKGITGMDQHLVQHVCLYLGLFPLEN